MRYFFHYRRAKTFIADVEGTELFDSKAAREEGRVSARELLGMDRGRRSSRYLGGRFEITDAAGLFVGTVEFRDANLA